LLQVERRIMIPIYLCQDGSQPSGVATYGYAVLRRFPEARMLLLNAATIPPAAPRAVAGQITLLSEAVSHDPTAVAQAILDIAGRCDGPLAILPNTGDTPWAATALFLRSAPEALRKRVRVLGIVHSDMDTQYALAERYRTIAPIWIGVSWRCATELRRRLGKSAVTVQELPYPISIPPAVPRREDGPLRLAYVGRLEEPQKRVSRLVPLFTELVRRGVNFTVTIAGDGPAAADFDHALAAAGPEVVARVRQVGALGRDGIDEIWRTHDVALLVSAFEGLPLALLEAMAAGVCPVVMAIESGLDELLSDGAQGRVVPQGDIAAMTEVLAGLALDRALLRRIGEAARRRVQERFSPEAHFASLSTILARLARTEAPDASALVPDPTAEAVRQIVDAAAASGRPVAIFGAGMFGRKVVDACCARGLCIGGWFDSDGSREGTTYRGFVCENPKAIVARAELVFIAASLQFASAIAARIETEFSSAGRKRPTIITPQP
jgi:glycosyltransferase involved in cell wall biosynthesis